MVADNWPVTMALSEQPLDTKPVFDAAQRLTTCDGEWLALHALVHAGWSPSDPSNRVGRDWTVINAGRALPIEVKTKQSQGSDLGRLRFALRGLAMTPEGGILRRFVLNWSGATDLTRKAIAAYYELLRSNLAVLDQILRDDMPLYDTQDVASTSAASLSVQRFDTQKFAMDFQFTDPSATDGERVKNHISLILEPNPYTRYLRIGAVDARFLRPPDEAMLDEIEMYVLNRLGIAAQALKRSADTVVVVIWEVPFHWTLDVPAVEARWRAWSAAVGLAHGVLIPVQLFEPPTMLLTADAEALFPQLLHIFA